MLLVEFVGVKGSGKTSLACSVAIQMMSSPEQSDIALILSPADDIYREKIRHLLMRNVNSIKALAGSFMSAPYITYAAASMALRARTNHRYGYPGLYIYLVRKIYTVAALRARSGEAEAPGYVFFDAGIVRSLYGLGRPVSPGFLSRCPLPDVVVQVHAAPCDAAWRRVVRSKATETKKYGEERRQKAARLASQFVVDRGVCEAREFLKQWNQRFCSPPLDETELSDIVTQAQNMQAAPASSQRSQPWIRHAMETVGVKWIEMNNGPDSTLDSNAQVLADMLTKMRS